MQNLKLAKLQSWDFKRDLLYIVETVKFNLTSYCNLLNIF